MFFISVLLISAASLFGLAADAVMQKEKTVIQEIKVNPVYCFNKPSEKLIIRPDFIGCIVGEDEPLGQTELKEGTERPTQLHPQLLARFHRHDRAQKWLHWLLAMMLLIYRDSNLHLERVPTGV